MIVPKNGIPLRWAGIQCRRSPRSSFGEKYTVYSLRHFYAVNALRNGVGVFEVARNMKYALIIATVASLATPALADEVGVGVGVGPVGAGVTVGQSHRDWDRDRDHTTVIKEREREPTDRTTVIKKENEDGSRSKTVIHDRDRE